MSWSPESSWWSPPLGKVDGEGDTAHNSCTFAGGDIGGM